MRTLGISWLAGRIEVALRAWRASRDLLFALTRRDLVLRYRQAVLGVAWAVMTPLLLMLVFTLVFTRVTSLVLDVPYPVYAYAGLLPWNLTAAALRFATVSLSNNAVLLTKIRFPRVLLPLSAVLVSLVDFAVAASVLAVLMGMYRIGAHWTVLLLPIVIGVQVAFTVGLALLLSVANLFFRDVRHLVDVLLMVWMFATSVVYPVDRIGGAPGTVLALNPMTPIIDAYRALLLYGTLPAAGPFLGAAGIAVATCLLGVLVFRRTEGRFAEIA